MPGTSLTGSPVRELASRAHGGAEITLFWNERTGDVTVSVRSRESGWHTEFAVAPAKALQAFYHPYTYAAPVSRWHGTTQVA